MPAIAEIGTEVVVTPGDEVQIVFAPGRYEFSDDRSPFSLRIAGVMEEAGQIIGVFGEVISGHRRYRAQTATIFVRLNHSDWRRVTRVTLHALSLRSRHGSRHGHLWVTADALRINSWH
jgi:ribosomal protein L28